MTDVEHSIATERHIDTLSSLSGVSNTVLDSTVALIKHLESLHNTLKTHQNPDNSGLESLIGQLLDQTKQIPKTTPDIPTPIDNTKLLQAVETAIKELRTALDDKNLHVDAPVVNIPAPIVNVDAPDMRPVADSIKALGKDKPDVVDGLMQTQDMNGLITERYDQFKITYITDDFGDDEEKSVGSVKYYYKRKLVATLEASYDSKGNLKAVKKT